MPARPEIFISATTKDLKSCRQLVRDALLTLGCVPVAQDHFAPEAATVREMLRKRIAACDAVIHLAGKCYGFEPQERAPGEPRRSYTQMEYDIARELDKPLYTFVCAPDFPYDAHEAEDDERRALQDAHRAALAAGDNLYVPVKDAQELNLRVHELQTRVDDLGRDLEKTRAWLGRGLAVALTVLALIGGVLWFEHRQAAQTEQKVARTEQKVAQATDELDRYRQAVKALADNYGQDIEPGRKLTDEEKFDRALAAVAAKQGVGVGELKTWLALFVAQVRANPGADFYDKALADFAEKHFADAAANATKSAEQFRAQRDAAEKEQVAAGQRGAEAREKERRAWTLVGDSESAAGRYAAAVEPYRQAFALCDENKNPLLWCNAAQPYEAALRRMGRDTEAEPLVRQLVDRRTVLLGPEHPNTLSGIHDLAAVLEAEGDYDAAEALARRTLEARERTLGSDHPDTLQSVIGLSYVLDERGDYDAAEALARRALEARERTLGRDHPDTLESVRRLAHLLHEKGDYTAAEPLIRRALEASERTLGKDHPFTLSCVRSLGLVFHRKGDYAAAEPLYRRVLEASERTLGKEHPSTQVAVDNLATLLGAKGDYAAAEPLLRRSLEVCERTMGREHPYTLTCVSHLASLLRDKGDLVAAEPLYRRALEARERILGNRHSDTAVTANSYSLLLHKLGRLGEALPLAEEAVAIARATLPASHPSQRRYEQHLAELQAQIASAKEGSH